MPKKLCYILEHNSSGKMTIIINIDDIIIMGDDTKEILILKKVLIK